MAPSAIAPELAQRLDNYALDERARRVLRNLGPLIEPQLEPALDEVIAGAVKLPHVAELWTRHGADMRRIELAQYRTLLKGEFDARYLESCRSTIEQETALGFESRARVNCGSALLRHAFRALAREHRFRLSAFTECTQVLSQAVMFDIATTSTFYLQIVEKAAQARRRVIDEPLPASAVPSAMSSSRSSRPRRR